MQPNSLAVSTSPRPSTPAGRRLGIRLPLAIVLIGAASACSFVALYQAPMPEEIALASIELLFAPAAELTP
jgi:hypothetical protein